MGQYCFAGFRLLSSVTLPAGGPQGAWERGMGTLPAVGASAAGHVGGQAADTAWWASHVTSHYGDTLLQYANCRSNCGSLFA